MLLADANAQIATGQVFMLLFLAEILNPIRAVLFCTQTNNPQILSSIASLVNQLIKLPDQLEYCFSSVK
jgi:hypothetical protein